MWRRPRPTLGLRDPDYADRVEQIRTLLHSLPSDETALFQDEFDVRLNPKIGVCWMRRGQQAEGRHAWQQPEAACGGLTPRENWHAARQRAKHAAELRVAITRNHRNGSLDELLQHAYRWFDYQPGFFREMRNTYQAAA